MRRHFSLYRSWNHVAVTVLFVLLPFVYFLAVSQLAGIDAGSFLQGVVVSFFRILIAYSIAVTLAWFCAITFYQGKVSEIALPFFDVLQSFPTFALLPLVTYVWGPQTVTVIFFLVITIIWPSLFSIISSLRSARQDWIEAAQMSGISGFKYIRHFLWPISLPGVITGSVIGLGEAWEALVATEIIVGINTGLGSFFKSVSQNGYLTGLGIFGLLVLIFCINKLVWLPLLSFSHRKMEE
jgi:ABC-type nitrate/sulfonate/bicarbonate transport system permease component